MHCNPPGFSIHGIFQARILEQVAIPIPRHPPYLGIKSTSLGSAAFGRQVLYHCVTWKPNVSVP